MRKRTSVLCAVLVAALVIPAVASAQESRLQWGLGYGPVWPQGDFKQEAKGPAYHVMGSVGYQPSILPFQIQAEVYFQDFRNVAREPSLAVQIGGEWFRELSLLLNARYVLPTSVVQPYVLAGTGLMREWYDDRAYWRRQTTNVGLNVGAGIEVPVIAGMSAFIEGRYMNIVAGSSLPLRAPATQPEVDFQTTPLTIGIKF